MNTIFRLWMLVVILLTQGQMEAAEVYKIDPAHTSVGFSARHLGINDVKGVFRKFEGVLVVDNGKLIEASGSIDVQSIDTGIDKRDNHLRSPDFFDASKYPTITFKTKRVEQNDGKNPLLIADFTMKGVTRELRLPAKLSGPVKDHTGAMRIGLETKSKVNRKDYGIKYHQVLEGGILAVSDEIEIEINAEALPQAATTKATQ